MFYSRASVLLLKRMSSHASALLFSLWQSSSDDCDLHEGIQEGKEGKYRLQVTQFVQRLEYWHKELTNTLVTSINVVQVHGRAVAYLGTADGRHIQVKNWLPFFCCCCSFVRHIPECGEPRLCGKQQLGTNREPEAAVAAVVSPLHCSCKCCRMLVRDE